MLETEHVEVRETENVMQIYSTQTELHGRAHSARKRHSMNALQSVCRNRVQSPQQKGRCAVLAEEEETAWRVNASGGAEAVRQYGGAGADRCAAHGVRRRRRIAVQ
jgi:hypothetical protein